MGLVLASEFFRSSEGSVLFSQCTQGVGTSTRAVLFLDRSLSLPSSFSKAMLFGEKGVKLTNYIIFICSFRENPHCLVSQTSGPDSQLASWDHGELINLSGLQSPQL